MLNNSSETLAKWAGIVGVFAIVTMVIGGIAGLVTFFDSFIAGIIVIAASIISGLFILLFANLLNAISETLKLSTQIRAEQKSIRAMLERSASGAAEGCESSTPASRTTISKASKASYNSGKASSSGSKGWYCSCGALNPGNANECQSCFAPKPNN